MMSLEKKRRTQRVKDTHSIFDEVLEMLQQERRRFDEDLERLTVAATYLISLLPASKRRTNRGRRRRLRCTPRRR
jgi:hypothetical protein